MLAWGVLLKEALWYIRETRGSFPLPSHWHLSSPLVAPEQWQKQWCICSPMLFRLGVQDVGVQDVVLPLPRMATMSSGERGPQRFAICFGPMTWRMKHDAWQLELMYYK